MQHLQLMGDAMSLNTIKILVTGANGFLGSNLLKAYAQHNMETIAACRDNPIISRAKYVKAICAILHT